MNIVIGYDGSVAAKHAIEGLQRAGLPLDTTALVVSVADIWPPLPASLRDAKMQPPNWQASPIATKARLLAEKAIDEARALALEGDDLVESAFPKWAVSHAAFAGAPHLALMMKRENPVDLIVVGAQGGTALTRLILGSVSQNVLSHASCSVCIARFPVAVGGAEEHPVRVLVGVDGSANSMLTIEAIKRRTWPPGTEVKLMTVMDAKFWSALVVPDVLGPIWTWSGQDDGRPAAERALEALAIPLRSSDLVVTTKVQEGDPKRMLIEEAERWSANCIFLGAKGHGAVERLLLGSVSMAVAARAGCSVEIIR